MQLILASGSPRRRELLSLFGIPFAVRAADIDETMDPQKPPFDEVARVSRCKALAVPHEKDDLIVAADTIDEHILAALKQKDKTQAALIRAVKAVIA